MKGNQLVWRTLADAAVEGRPRWDSIAELGARAGVPTSTAHLAVQRLSACGAVEQSPTGGLAVVNLEKTLSILAVSRSFDADLLARTTLGAAQRLMNGRRRYAIGGVEAAAAHLRRPALVDPGIRLLYLAGSSVIGVLPEGDDVVLLRMDAAAERDWITGRASPAQTYADLFALPGRPAETHRLALRRRLVPDADSREAVTEAVPAIA